MPDACIQISTVIRAGEVINQKFNRFWAAPDSFQGSGGMKFFNDVKFL
jgi:hypothetical protein